MKSFEIKRQKVQLFQYFIVIERTYPEMKRFGKKRFNWQTSVQINTQLNTKVIQFN